MGNWYPKPPLPPEKSPVPDQVSREPSWGIRVLALWSAASVTISVTVTALVMRWVV